MGHPGKDKRRGGWLTLVQVGGGGGNLAGEEALLDHSVARLHAHTAPLRPLPRWRRGRPRRCRLLFYLHQLDTCPPPPRGTTDNGRLSPGAALQCTSERGAARKEFIWWSGRAASPLITTPQARHTRPCGSDERTEMRTFASWSGRGSNANHQSPRACEFNTGTDHCR